VNDAAPTPKVTASLIGGAIVNVVFGLADWLGASDPPALLVGGLTLLASFAAGYLKRDES
jgi:hypothetical protein